MEIPLTNYYFAKLATGQHQPTHVACMECCGPDVSCSRFDSYFAEGQPGHCEDELYDLSVKLEAVQVHGKKHSETFL
tara:strand:- start:648 stop:878 length:231 start_codon:yes stop_codon:yes gene_type:complete